MRRDISRSDALLVFVTTKRIVDFCVSLRVRKFNYRPPRFDIEEKFESLLESVKRW